MVTVTINGEEPEALTDVQDTSKTGDLGKATIVCGRTQFNQTTFGSGDKVQIERANGDTWNGYVSGRPSKSSDGTLEIEVMDTRYELKNLDINRPFFDMDSGVIVEEALTKEADGLGRQTIHTGDTTAGWDTDAPIFELAELEKEKLHDRGGDLVFLGIRKESTGSYRATYEDVPSSAIPGDGQIFRLETRLMVNDPGNQIEGEIELRDNAGNTYVWEVEYRSPDFDEYELEAEDASSDGELTEDGTLEYRFDLSGELSDNVGIVIDHASTFPFALDDRDGDIGAENVEETGRKVTRRFDKSVLELVQDFETEDGYTSWVDSDDGFHFEQAGGESTDLQIVRGETPVTDATFNTKYDDIDNKVTVQGKGNIQTTVRDPSSIEFYGVAARSEPLVDENIQTQAEAEDRGRGYLEEHAWNDTVATFEIADTSYQRVRKGDAIYIDWPSQGLEGDFVVRKKEVDEAGLVKLSTGVRV